jgi:hypothetical protein
MEAVLPSCHTFSDGLSDKDGQYENLFHNLDGFVTFLIQHRMTIVSFIMIFSWNIPNTATSNETIKSRFEFILHSLFC